MSKQKLAFLIFIPATVLWIIFVPCFRFANWITDRMNIHKPKYATWFWMNVQVTDHKRAYDYYE